MSLSNNRVELKIATILFFGFVLAFWASDIRAQRAKAANASRNTRVTVGKSFRVGEHRARAFQIGKTNFGAVQIDDHTTVIFLQPEGGTGGGDGGDIWACVRCRISHISDCANTCTSADIKRDGNCSVVIQQCLDQKCANECSNTNRGSFSVFIE